ncbi:uncharacterized protein LOC135401425 [Ornithodoros turicata]|uniref:uncharacterized protein LOC135401425 n=1 Tax=Ornithodoros turicata TaxID=34597 RepID=UPI003139952B
MKVVAFFVAFSALVAVGTLACSTSDNVPEHVESCAKDLPGLGYDVAFDDNTDVTDPATRQKLCCGVRYVENCVKPKFAGTDCFDPAVAFVRYSLQQGFGLDFESDCGGETVQCAF